MVQHWSAAENGFFALQTRSGFYRETPLANVGSKIQQVVLLVACRANEAGGNVLTWIGSAKKTVHAER